MAEMVFLIELLALYKSRNLSVKRRYKRKSPQNIGDWHYIEHIDRVNRNSLKQVRSV